MSGVVFSGSARSICRTLLNAERDFLSDAGIHLMQGYLFSRPVFRGVGRVDAVAWGEPRVGLA